MDLLARMPQMTTHPVDVGQRSEAAILAALVRRDFHVLLPFGVNQRYDLVIDLDGEFVRAQCKTGRLRNGSICFHTKSTRVNTRHWVSSGYRGQADIFLVHCPETGGVYVVPVEAAPAHLMHLRVDPTSNRQGSRINWARDFELPG
jgi:PD-(D/E)XK endonuclease